MSRPIKATPVLDIDEYNVLWEKLKHGENMKIAVHLKDAVEITRKLKQLGVNPSVGAL